ncbi:MAG: DUF2341 domain-containing protein [Nanoarchaeota archaeon]|nr:DUF2341 domain-containing protein [Nanoarchaeota archaeon]
MEIKVFHWNRIIGIIIIFTMFFSISFSWWDTNWGYKQDLEISVTYATPANYQILIHLNSTQLGVNFDWANNCDDLRFIYNNVTLIDHWTQTCDTIGEEFYVWVEMPNVMAAGSTHTIELYYSNPSTTSISNASATFIPNQIYRINGRCIDGTYCNGMDDNAEVNYIKSQIGVSPFDIDGSDYVTQINHNSNPFGADDDYYSRYRFLFIPDSNGNYRFGTNSDDGSEAIFLPYDSYGNGIATTGTFGTGTVLANWYGLHGTGTCGSSGTTNSQTLSLGEGYWIDYVMNERGGGQLAQMCIRRGGTYDIVDIVNFPNQIYSRQYVETDPLLSNISEEINYASIQEVLLSPSPISTIFIFQNNTFTVNTTIECIGPPGTNCGNVSIEVTQNSSGSFSPISTSDITPLWTSSLNPQICTSLSEGNSCFASFEINATGIIGNFYNFKLETTTDDTTIQGINSSDFTLRIIDSNIVSFNQSIYNFSPFEKDTGNKNTILQVVSNIGDNTNIQVSCTSGNCSTITHTFTNGISLLEGNSEPIVFTCDDTSSGNYSATFTVQSASNPYNSTIEVNCNVNPIYGPMTSFLLNPTPLSTINVAQNQSFNLEAQVNCTGLCGTLSAYAIRGVSNWFDPDFLFRKQINIDIITATPTNYQIFLNFDSIDLGSDFKWSNNCSDIRFVDGSTELDYWIEECNTISETLNVWIKNPNAQSAGSTFSPHLYYNNDFAVSRSNASTTFRENEIHILTGRCSGGGNCDMDNHGEADTLRANVGTSGMEIDGTGYVTAINDIDNPFGSNDNFYSRYRLLFIPQNNGSYSFGTYSDDDSEIAIFPSDGYGSGFQTTHPFGAHDVITTQYGTWHNNGACGSNVAIEGSRTLTSGIGYWLEYLHIEGTGGEDQQMCINRGSGYEVFDLTNFEGEFFARSYVAIEPTLNSLGPQEDFLISTVSGDIPLWTLDSQPQTCTPSEDGNCIFSWNVNATGAIDSLHNVSVYFVSSREDISITQTQIATINITNFIPPQFTLMTPLNNSKIVSNNTQINLSWIVVDEDPSIVSNLYINGVFNQSITCTTSILCNVSLNFTRGLYTWFVNGSDSTLNSGQSEQQEFTVIKNYHARISKGISFISTNLYTINITSNNILELNRNITLLDKVESPFIPGSFTPLFTQNFLEIYSWNQQIANNYTISYLVSNPSNAKISSLYMVGLE